MRLWAVAMVRDEIDVLPYTLAHLNTQGLAGIIVADNGSTDGTREWLDAADLDCQLVVVDDPEVGYYQSRKMTALFEMARAQAATWVMPFDADELWYDSAGRRLADAIRRGDCLQARLHNYFPSSSDDPNEPNPFLRITHRDPNPAPLPKVIVRALPGIVIDQGNHGAHRNRAFRQEGTSIEVAHFPWRSPEQFERKIRNGFEAYRATDLPEDMGAHWRGYGQILETGGPAAVREIYDTWFCDPDTDVEIRPAPWRKTP